MQLSVIIPIHDEEENLPALRDRLKEALDGLGLRYEVIFINDGSTDASARRLNEIAEADPRYKVLHLARNFGQTAAMMAGFDHASGETIVCMDGDLQNDPRDIPLLLEKLDQGFDVCSGWRKDRKDHPLTRNLVSRLANLLISGISGVRLNDYGCTLKAYRRNAIKGVKLYGEMHRFIPIYATWLGARVAEVPVLHQPRRHGRSKYGLERTFKVVLDLIVVKFLSRYTEKPIYIFGGFGLLSIFASFVCFIWMLYYKVTGQKDFVETPIPLLVVMFFLMGFTSILMGLIAELAVRTYYESQGKRIYLVSESRNLPGDQPSAEEK